MQARITELNTFAEQANLLAESVNTLKDETQAIKEAAVNETTQIKESAVSALNTIKEAAATQTGKLKQEALNARDEALLARDEAVGAVATLPDGIINDATISTTDTWSSDKISKQTIVSKPTITSPTNGKIDFIGAVTATYATSSTYTPTLQDRKSVV